MAVEHPPEPEPQEDEDEDEDEDAEDEDAEEQDEDRDEDEDEDQPGQVLEDGGQCGELDRDATMLVRTCGQTQRTRQFYTSHLRCFAQAYLVASLDDAFSDGFPARTAAFDRMSRLHLLLKHAMDVLSVSGLCSRPSARRAAPERCRLPRTAGPQRRRVPTAGRAADQDVPAHGAAHGGRGSGDAAVAVTRLFSKTNQRLQKLNSISALVMPSADATTALSSPLGVAAPRFIAS